MNPSLMERFLGPSTDFFLFNQNDANISVTPIEKKTCLLTKRNVIATTIATTAALAAINNTTTTNPGTKVKNSSYSASKLKPYKGAKSSANLTQSSSPSPQSTYKKLASSSYTILNKSSYLDNNPVGSDPADDNTLNDNNDRVESSEKTLNGEDMKSNDDSSIISELISEIEDCKLNMNCFKSLINLERI